jgi:hypothetical protein
MAEGGREFGRFIVRHLDFRGFLTDEKPDPNPRWDKSLGSKHRKRNGYGTSTLAV